MKLLWFHLMPYTRLPDDFAEKHPSVWVDIDSRLFDATAAHAMYNEFMDELGGPCSTPLGLRPGLTWES